MDIKTVKTLMQEMARYGFHRIEWKGEGLAEAECGASAVKFRFFYHPKQQLKPRHILRRSMTTRPMIQPPS